MANVDGLPFQGEAHPDDDGRRTMSEAQLHHGDRQEVVYRDAGAGVYLRWNARDPYMVEVLSADRERTLGHFAGAGGTAGAAHDDLPRHINTPGKPYGSWTAPHPLWEAGA